MAAKISNYVIPNHNNDDCQYEKIVLVVTYGLRRITIVGISSFRQDLNVRCFGYGLKA